MLLKVLSSGSACYAGQHLDEEQHARLASYFGAPFQGSNRFDHEQSGPTDVKVVSNFHSDLMYREDQPAFAMLQMLELPSVGGDTMWADLAASYEALRRWRAEALAR